MKEQVAKILFYWRYLVKRFVFAWQIETAYAGSVVGDLVSTLVYNITFITFLAVLLAKIKLLAGYSFNDMLVLTFCMQVSFYTALTFTYESVGLFTTSIKDGSFDTLLLKPLSLLFQAMTMGLRPFSGFFFSLPPLGLYIFLIIKNNAFHPTLRQFVLGTCSMILGLFIMHVYRYAIAMIAFKLQEVRNVFKMIDLFADFGAYPYEMYKNPLLTIVMFVAPLLLAAAVPASYFLGKSTTLTPFIIQITFALFFSVLCLVLWRKGLRIYESASS